MKLKSKTAGLIGVTMGLFIIVLFLFIRPMILNDAKLLDEESLTIDSKRANSYIETERTGLQRLNRDWAVWDDTYEFLQNRNEGYIESNIMLETFENNAINFMMFLDANGEIVFTEGYDLENGTLLDMDTDFPPVPELVTTIEEQNGNAILKNEKFGYLLMVSELVLTSEGEGPPAGHLIMGKFLNKTFFDNMQADLAIDVRTIGSVGQDESSSSEIKEINAQLLSRQVPAGGDLVLEVQKERKYFQEKSKSMNDLFLSLSLATLLLVFLVYYLLDLFVLSRISYLSIQLKDVDFDKPLTLNVRNSKNVNDEITDLEQSIQEMLGSLEKAHRDVSKLALYDQLTGLPNRFSLYKEFDKRIKKEDSSFAVLFFDLDGFKRINDLYGHSSGDELLKQIGKRLTADALDTESLLFRIGGDEFILLTNCVDRIQLIQKIEEVMGHLRREFVLSKVTATISTSIGISFFPADGKALDDLLQYADSAMYEAKKTGKNNYVFYEELNNKHLYKYLLNLKTDLMTAVSLGQLYLEYQPIMDKTGSEIKRVEALARWTHPEHGLITPLHFIPLAEETGVMKEMGEWVIRNAVKDIAYWNREHDQSLAVAVNVSKSQLKFKTELLAFIDDVLDEYGFPAKLLQIEITESDTVAEHEEIASFIHELKMRCICVALDDFGVGSSSLFNLIKLDVDIVKIDRSFLRKVPAHKKDTILLKGIYRILNDLDIEIVTEGIETAEQMEFAIMKNGSYLQGFYFSKPVPLNQLKKIQDQNIKNLI